MSRKRKGETLPEIPDDPYADGLQSPPKIHRSAELKKDLVLDSFSCSICSADDIPEDQYIVLRGCKHGFCCKCMAGLLNGTHKISGPAPSQLTIDAYGLTCPLCRAKTKAVLFEGYHEFDFPVPRSYKRHMICTCAHRYASKAEHALKCGLRKIPCHYDDCKGSFFKGDTIQAYESNLIAHALDECTHKVACQHQACDGKSHFTLKGAKDHYMRHLCQEMLILMHAEVIRNLHLKIFRQSFDLTQLVIQTYHDGVLESLKMSDASTCEALHEWYQHSNQILDPSKWYNFAEALHGDHRDWRVNYKNHSLV